VDEINAQFASFDARLASTVVNLGLAQMVCKKRELEEVRLDSDRLEANINKLEEDLERWQAVKKYLETGIDLGAPDENLKKNLQDVKFVDDNLCLHILDKMFAEIPIVDCAEVKDEEVQDEEIQDEEVQDEEIQDDEVQYEEIQDDELQYEDIQDEEADGAEVKKQTKQKKTRLIVKKTTVTFKTHPVSKMTTRGQRHNKGLSLVNPFQYFDCLLSGCKAGYYTERELRKHYLDKHGLNFGKDPLPTSDLQIELIREREKIRNNESSATIEESSE